MVAEGKHVLGVIALKDIVKGGIRTLCQLRKWDQNGDDTGDNRLTATAIAARRRG